MSDWYPAGLEDDMRPRLFAAADRGEAIALVTIVAAEGGGPRGVGAQMAITAAEAAGFLSGGCIEADVILHARATLADGQPREIVYGRGSPYVDTKLPCGGRLELLVERLEPTDPAIRDLRLAEAQRRLVVYASDGRRRSVAPAGDETAGRAYPPRQRLVVIGSDPFALAIAGLGLTAGWSVDLIRPKGPEAAPPLPVGYHRGTIAQAFADLRPDPWTAVAVATHDADLDHDALIHALRSPAEYVGVLGARRRLPDRIRRLVAAGLSPEALSRLKAPIGLAIGARTPAEIAVAVIGEIIAMRR
ncbi:XdhC family protein [Brevundimonas sp.]|uniref:XdhC family protein n=1 Tax=Brevundimonas sp. TaxID=1871086 RepID=UPI002896D59E|nr:XdhC family protein [Brevundimonas sp.]